MRFKYIYSLLKDFVYFFKESKKWWLVPLVFILLLLGIFLVVIEGSALAPFIYTLF